jgi:hypothetical protein
MANIPRAIRHPAIWVLAVLLMLFVLAVAIFGWGWTGFNSKVGPQLVNNEQYRPAKTLWDWLQLLIIPASIAAGTFWLDSRRKRAEDERRLILSQYAGLHAYAQEQYGALIFAYVRLYEGEGALASGSAFGRLADEADKRVMRAYRKGKPLLDDQLEARILGIHNALAQVQNSPSEVTLKNFRDWKSKFYEEISDIGKLLRPEQILYRRRLISRPFKARSGGYREGHPNNLH